MNKYGIDEATEAKLYDEAEEYSKTDEFELDKQDMQYKLQMEGKEIPDDEKLNEMVKEQYVDIRCRELYCKKNGHTWKETNPDPENGTSDLDCECCGEHHTLQWL